MADNKISFEVQSLLNAFAETVFRTPEDVLRELLTNAQDACILRKVQDADYADAVITVSADDQSHSLSVADNGVGMTEDDLRDYFSTFGASSSRSLKRHLGLSASDALVGSCGIGTIAYFIVADQMKSLRDQSKLARMGFAGHSAVEKPTRSTQ